MRGAENYIGIDWVITTLGKQCTSKYNVDIRRDKNPSGEGKKNQPIFANTPAKYHNRTSPLIIYITLRK
jgi:hypothetical protein